MFSIIFVMCCLYGFKVSFSKSKPTDMYLNPVEAKNHIVDRYIEIQAMPEGMEKKQAHKVWQESCHQIKKLQE